MDWLKITIHTTTEGAEIVSQLMMDAGAGGTTIEDRNDVRQNQRPEGQWDILPETLAQNMSEDVLVTAYFEMETTADDALKQITQGLEQFKSMDLGLDLGSLSLETDRQQDQNWLTSWRQEYKPFLVGSRIIVKPSWEECQPKQGQHVLQIDPGMAFGTGTHETTSLCVHLLEKYVQPGDAAIDVGTGTGILAMAAVLSGAERVLAIDIDKTAVKVAKQNIIDNGFEQQIDCVWGDLLTSVDWVGDVVVANIIADVIVGFAQPVTRHIRPGGVFICSGIVAEREGDVCAALSAANYKILDIVRQGEWVAIAARNGV